MHRSEPHARGDSGFTLIELMVVLLIIAILLAIAIPTFLGARNTANGRSAQEYARNALTAEGTAYASSQSFANSLGADEPSLQWTTSGLSHSAQGQAVVETGLYTESVSGSTLTTTATSSAADGVEIVAFGKDANCYALYQSNNPSMAFTAYQQWPAATSSPYCDLATPPASTPTSGAASQSPGTGSASGWYTSF